jgi:hypothetical protein
MRSSRPDSVWLGTSGKDQFDGRNPARHSLLRIRTRSSRARLVCSDETSSANTVENMEEQTALR